MTSLDDIFRKAMQARPGWTRHDVHELASTLLRKGLHVDWEEGDENWCRILDAEGQTHALVCALVPLVFVRGDMSPTPSVPEACCVAFQDEDAPEFSVDEALLAECFEKPMTNVVDFGRLSVQELWYATVT